MANHWAYKKYLVMSYHPFQNGYDEKMDFDNLNEAKRECKQLLFHDNDNFEWYEKMYILTENEVVMVFDEQSRRGRKPYPHECAEFHFEKREQPIQYELF